MNGDFIEARGFRDGSDVVAAEIERDDFAPDLPTRLRAPADDAPVIDAGGQLLLSLLGIDVVGAPGVTVFEDDADNVVSLQGFADLTGRGTVVEVQWDTFSGSGIPADSMSIEEEGD